MPLKKPCFAQNKGTTLRPPFITWGREIFHLFHREMLHLFHREIFHPFHKEIFHLLNEENFTCFTGRYFTRFIRRYFTCLMRRISPVSQGDNTSILSIPQTVFTTYVISNMII